MEKSHDYNEYIDVIGGTHLDETMDKCTRYWNTYYRNQERSCVKYFLGKYVNDRHYVLDLGCSWGAWFNEFKSFGFDAIEGVDLSEKRLKIAEKYYDKVYHADAKNLPFEDSSLPLIISNDMLVHVLRNQNKIEIIEEINRILNKNGYFLMNFTSAKGYGFSEDTVVEYCSFNTLESMTKIVRQGGMEVVEIKPAYAGKPLFRGISIIPWVIPKVYPLFDKVINLINIEMAKVIYLMCKTK